MARFTFEDTKPVITNEQLLADLSRVARELGLASLPQGTYRKHGRYSSTAVKDRFGGWNAAAAAAGLGRASERDIPESLLHQNLEEVWIRLGRQPRKRDMVTPISRFTHNPYVRRWGGWLGAVRAFLRAIDLAAPSGPADESALSVATKGPRDPSLRLRFIVMRRDRFSCCHCGASPAKNPVVQLHVDHVLAWSQGGATVLENLQTLCSGCNLGKSNLLDSDAG